MVLVDALPSSSVPAGLKPDLVPKACKEFEANVLYCTIPPPFPVVTNLSSTVGCYDSPRRCSRSRAERKPKRFEKSLCILSLFNWFDLVQVVQARKGDHTPPLLCMQWARRAEEKVFLSRRNSPLHWCCIILQIRTWTATNKDCRKRGGRGWNEELRIAITTGVFSVGKNAAPVVPYVLVDNLC